MNFKFISSITQFVSFILLQVILFNHIHFLGYINPYIYVLFIVWFPIENNKSQFLLLSFLLGFTIDVFSDSLAINAAAAVTTAYFRTTVLQFLFGANYKLQNFKFSSISVTQKMLYLFVLILLHHLVLFFIEIFSFTQIELIIQKTLFTTILTFILGQLFSFLFFTSKK